MTRIVSWTKSNTLRTLSLRCRSPRSLHDFRSLIEACSTTLNLDVVLDSNLFGSISRFTWIRPFVAPFIRSIKSISSLSPIHLTLRLRLALQIMRSPPSIGIGPSSLLPPCFSPSSTTPLRFISTTKPRKTWMLCSLMSSLPLNEILK